MVNHIVSLFITLFYGTMKTTTRKASKEKSGKRKQNSKAATKKPKGKVQKGDSRKANTNKVKFSRQNANAKNGKKVVSKDPTKKKNGSILKGKGASGALSSKAAKNSNKRKVTFNIDKTSNSPTVPPKKSKKANSKNDIVSVHYKEQLKNLEPTLATLPKFMQKDTRDFALILLTQRNVIQHKVNVVKKFDDNPDFIPASARFKFTLTCCTDLKDDASQESDAEEIRQGIENLQLLIRDKTRNTVEREIQVLKIKLVNETFIFLFKTMKTGFILFKALFPNLKFNKSDNAIVKTGIVRYFDDQTHEEYDKYFFMDKQNLLKIIRETKDDVFNNNLPATQENDNALEKSPDDLTTPELPKAVAAMDTSKTTLHNDMKYLTEVKDDESNQDSDVSLEDIEYRSKILDGEQTGVRDEDTEKISFTKNEGPTIEIIDDDSSFKSSDEKISENLNSQESERQSLSSQASTSLVNISEKLRNGETVVLSQAQPNNFQKRAKTDTTNSDEPTKKPKHLKKELETIEENENEKDSETKLREVTTKKFSPQELNANQTDPMYSHGFDNLRGIYYVKDQLSRILPKLTYKIHNSYQQKLEQKRGEKLAQAFYTSFSINEATDATAAALEREPKVCPESMETLISNISNEIVDKKLKELNFPKNFRGGQQNHLSQPQKNGTKRKSTTILEQAAEKMRRLHKTERRSSRKLIYLQKEKEREKEVQDECQKGNEQSEGK